MTMRARLVALAVVLALTLAGGTVVLVRSRTADCGIAPPRPALPAELRALGDFDQAYDVSNTPVLQDAAERAASAVHPDLIGTTPELPVAVTAAQRGSPDAVVVPLRAHPSSQGTAPLAGLVVFLRDCLGNGYFASVEDDATAQPALADFPAVSRDQAAARLGTAAIRLTYAASPLTPVWTTLAMPAQSLAGR